MLDLGDPWRLAVSPVELVLRSLAVYAIFLVALRVSGKWELGQAVLEHDGTISIVPRAGPELRIRKGGRRYRSRGPAR